MTFKPFRVSITLRDPEEAENFLRGLIVARTNNSAPQFVELIDGVNEAMTDYRRVKLLADVEARDNPQTPR